jgi:hypothetical protein
MGLLLEVCLYRDGAAVHVVDHQHLSQWNGLAGDKARSKVNCGGAELDAWLACMANQEEVVFWTTHNLHHKLVVLEMVLSNRQVGDLEFDLFALWHAASFWSDCDVLVDLALPDEVKVELSVVLQDDLLGLPLIDEELTEIELVRLSSLHLDAA